MPDDIFQNNPTANARTKLAKTRNTVQFHQQTAGVNGILNNERISDAANGDQRATFLSPMEQDVKGKRTQEFSKVRRIHNFSLEQSSIVEESVAYNLNLQATDHNISIKLN